MEDGILPNVLQLCLVSGYGFACRNYPFADTELAFSSSCASDALKGCAASMALYPEH